MELIYQVHSLSFHNIVQRFIIEIVVPTYDQSSKHTETVVSSLWNSRSNTISRSNMETVVSLFNLTQSVDLTWSGRIVQFNTISRSNLRQCSLKHGLLSFCQGSVVPSGKSSYQQAVSHFIKDVTFH